MTKQFLLFGMVLFLLLTGCGIENTPVDSRQMIFKGENQNWEAIFTITTNKNIIVKELQLRKKNFIKKNTSNAVKYTLVGDHLRKQGEDNLFPNGVIKHSTSGTLNIPKLNDKFTLTVEWENIIETITLVSNQYR